MTSAAADHGQLSANETIGGAAHGREGERGDDPEIAAAAARLAQNRSPSSPLLLGGAVPQGAVGGDDVDRVQPVAGEPERAADHALPAAERQAADADGRARAGGKRDAGRGQPGVDVDQAGPGADGRGAVGGVDAAAIRVTSMTSPSPVDQPP